MISMTSISHQLTIELRPDDDVEVLTAQIGQLLVEHRNAKQPNSQPAILGWTRQPMERFLTLLSSASPCHVQLLQEAVRLGGSVPRKRVLAILGRPSDAHLNGITRPMTRIMKDLWKQGQLSPDAELPLSPQYNDLGKADRLEVPDALIPMILEATRPHLSESA